MKFFKIPIIKMITRMSIYAFVFLLANPLLATTFYGQSLEKTKVSISLQKATVIEVFKIIEKQTPFSFVYDKSVSNKTDRVSFNNKDISLLSVLEILSKENLLEFKQINNSISVSVIPKVTEKKPEKEVVKRDIKGVVSDANGVPLPGVTIVLKGTAIGTSSDFDGNYTITVPDDAKTLVFSFIGFITKEVAINNQSVINVMLSEDVAQLDEVVVIGYGTSSKRDLIGSVTQLTSEDIKDLPVTSVDQVLVGQTSGMQFRQTGNPSSGPQILIRGIGSLGNNAPLYVVDGIPLTSVSNSGDNYLLNNINPADIESVSVLKDAGAKAIYGNRASNGVIIVKTKQGKKGKTQFSANVYSSFGWTQDFDRPHNLRNGNISKRTFGRPIYF